MNRSANNKRTSRGMRDNLKAKAVKMKQNGATALRSQISIDKMAQILLQDARFNMNRNEVQDFEAHENIRCSQTWIELSRQRKAEAANEALIRKELEKKTKVNKRPHPKPPRCSLNILSNEERIRHSVDSVHECNLVKHNGKSSGSNNTEQKADPVKTQHCDRIHHTLPSTRVSNHTLTNAPRIKANNHCEIETERWLETGDGSTSQPPNSPKQYYRGICEEKTRHNSCVFPTVFDPLMVSGRPACVEHHNNDIITKNKQTNKGIDKQDMKSNPVVITSVKLANKQQCVENKNGTFRYIKPFKGRPISSKRKSYSSYFQTNEAFEGWLPAITNQRNILCGISQYDIRGIHDAQKLSISTSSPDLSQSDDDVQIYQKCSSISPVHYPSFTDVYSNRDSNSLLGHCHDTIVDEGTGDCDMASQADSEAFYSSCSASTYDCAFDYLDNNNNKKSNNSEPKRNQDYDKDEEYSDAASKQHERDNDFYSESGASCVTSPGRNDFDRTNPSIIHKNSAGLTETPYSSVDDDHASAKSSTTVYESQSEESDQSQEEEETIPISYYDKIFAKCTTPVVPPPFPGRRNLSRDVENRRHEIIYGKFRSLPIRGTKKNTENSLEGQGEDGAQNAAVVESRVHRDGGVTGDRPRCATNPSKTVQVQGTKLQRHLKVLPQSSAPNRRGSTTTENVPKGVPRSFIDRNRQLSKTKANHLKAEVPTLKLAVIDCIDNVLRFINNDQDDNC